MAQFAIQFDTDSAAFDDAPEVETARILRDIASRIESGAIDSDGAVVHDINGNNIGQVMLDEGEEE